LEPANSALKIRRPWPTRKVFWNLALAMTGFGVLTGVMCPGIAVVFGIPAAQAMRPIPFAVGGTAGFLVGLMNYLVAYRVVGHRLHVLSGRLSAARTAIATSVGADSWETLADRYALPIDSDDAFGQTGASFNYLMSSLDSSQMAERSLRQSLVDQAKLAALGTLTAGVAHETKNPLNFVVNFTELNLELCAELREVAAEDGDELVSDLETNLNLIRHHAQRALAVMATMLQVGRTHVGDAHPCHLNQIVEQSARLADHSWRVNRRDARCAIHVELDDDDPTVPGFEGDLVQVIINLVTNGLEAASSATDRDGEVRITVQHDDEWAFLVVTDNGPGIDPEILPHIFEPFFTTKYRSGGTGLGLSISKNIVDDRHHGHLGVSSDPGVGTQFFAKLPLEAAATKVAAPA
jgi:signal transduction histidine kinase